MELLYLLEKIRNPFLDSFFSLITHLGSETLFIAAAIVIFWCVSKKNGYYLMTVGFFGTLINQFLKLVCRVPRPWVRDPQFTIVESAREGATGYSFPSGHTQNAVTVLGCPARTTKNRVLRAVCLVLILLTGLSRMYLGVHTPLDVCVSLVIGALLVFVFYPLFEACEEKPAYFCGIVGVLSLLSLAYVLFVELYSWPADTDSENLASGLKTGYLLLGCSTAMLISFGIERKKVRFSVEAPLRAQIGKVVFGLVLVMAIKSGLKPVLASVFGAHPVTTAIRYFIMVLFAVCVWPLTFPWFVKGCPIKRWVKRLLITIVSLIILLAALAGYLFWDATRDTPDQPISTEGAANPLITPLGVTMLSGHRAGGGIAPENTMMALKNCVENDVYELDIFEFDIHLTADGIPVLLHDSTLDRTSDAASCFGEENVEVGSKTLEELKQLNMGETFRADDSTRPYTGLRGDKIPEDLRIVTLDEALSYLEDCGDYRYIIEIKNSGEDGYRAADILYETLKNYDAVERTVVGTFHNEVTAYLDATYPDLPRSAGVNECIQFFVYSMFNWKAGEDTFGFDALQIPTTDYTINLGTSRVVNYAHKNNIAVQYWTINDPEEMERLQSIGADAIMTDVPDAAAAVLVQP
ncbi:MAG: phosphatase PAP2 family protein [Lachnospiraceae bacterium]|nr:phosphatase PAP2 family protein [Lachnospiraceae bacterium]